ncbi:uncharacterized protein LOC132917120 isoform X2 [Rhopalosiphum padi]|uniref:uncharacterized protein LOC132917120 isoform X2 n=1 Tax=Rhopalosiphum padi TaxID=40932 RepID=UPI00298E7836|nr:uncharacterized protein LOC132917120 isoform X2 [Rhopalosiphum padi]
MNKNKKKSGKKMCCIVNCSNTYLTGHKLFNFPNRPHEKELKEKWVQCIKRMNIDGTPWLPTANTVICSDHFIGNKPIRHPNSLAYIPSIFPTVCKKQVVNSNQQDSRYKRFCNRGIVPQSTSVVPPVLSSERKNSVPWLEEIGFLPIIPHDIFARHTGTYVGGRLAR